jgi:hypothetical protein
MNPHEDSIVAAARLWHPWLRIQRVLRDMLGHQWDRETWQVIRPELRNALAEKKQIERAGWIN